MVVNYVPGMMLDTEFTVISKTHMAPDRKELIVWDGNQTLNK